ncbi:MAG: maleylpyruvate isomerase family mycothiol-dependent enzyme [Dehalococcoidia bacterium]|nr:maleylpyruvate isomerase family mycothiol-dependent enzyme [Dehalococcoidia bacterium]
MSAAALRELAPVLVLDLFPEERAALLDLLSSLTDEEWGRPTVCPGWSAKDVAAHLLGDDIGRLSCGRDAFAAAFVPAGGGNFEAELLAFINRQNERWVEATRRLSPRLLIDLLRWSGEETQRYFESLDPYTAGEPVSWAGPEPAPVWLDVAREYTERWLHQQQIRDAVGKPGLKERRLFAPVLDTFARALPHAYRDVAAPAGTHVRLTISGDAGGAWSLVRGEVGWRLYAHADGEPQATAVLDQETAWRLLTKGISMDEALAAATISGERALGLKVLDTVSIIA